MSPFPFLALLSILAGGALAHSIHGAKYGACCQRALFELRQPTSEISGEYLVVYSAYWDAISVIMIMEIEETLCEIPVPVYLADLTNPGIAPKPQNPGRSWVKSWLILLKHVSIFFKSA